MYHCETIVSNGNVAFSSLTVTMFWLLRRRHALEKLVPETCTKRLMQVCHSFSCENNSPANHVARFVSRVAQFLCWNRAVLSCVRETCTRKKLVPD